MLLEHIEPGTKVSDEPRIPPVNEVAELLTGLRETTKYDAGQLPTMAQGVESMFSRIGGLLSNSAGERGSSPARPRRWVPQSP